jgi:hypothetical protein
MFAPAPAHPGQSCSKKRSRKFRAKTFRNEGDLSRTDKGRALFVDSDFDSEWKVLEYDDGGYFYDVLCILAALLSKG